MLEWPLQVPLLAQLDRIAEKHKNWKQAVKYLHSLDRARILRQCSSVLTLDIRVGLRQEIEKQNASQWSRKLNVVECSNNSGVTRCFVTPAYVTTCGLKLKSRDVFLEIL